MLQHSWQDQFFYAASQQLRTGLDCSSRPTSVPIPPEGNVLVRTAFIPITFNGTTEQPENEKTVWEYRDAATEK